jgi:hypothetical protein
MSHRPGREGGLALPTERLAYDDGSEHVHLAVIVFRVDGMATLPDVLDRLLQVVVALARMRPTSQAYR